MPKPKSRSEAVNEIIRTGVTISAMLAVDLAFPLNQGDTQAVTDYLARIRSFDAQWADGIETEVNRYLRAWGKLTDERDDFLHQLAREFAGLDDVRLHKLLVHVWNQALDTASERLHVEMDGARAREVLADLRLPPVD